MEKMIGIVAPSSVVPKVELSLGVERLQTEGFAVKQHPQVKKKDFFFAGTPDDRARAFMDFAQDPTLSVIFCARGGYGAMGMLAQLDGLFKKSGKTPPRKLLVGSSDAFAVMHYVKNHWNWSVLHSPMPANLPFQQMKGKDWKALVAWTRGEAVTEPWAGKKLKFLTPTPSSSIQGELVGGNLSLIAAMVGTPYLQNADFQPVGKQKKILFLEDIAETFSKIERMICQLRLAGVFDQLGGIVLGDFLDCNDRVPTVLSRIPKGREMGLVKAGQAQKLIKNPLRKKFKVNEAFKRIFAELGQDYGFPVAYGLPAGHGPGLCPLPIGAEYRLSPAGEFQMIQWDWLDRNSGLR